MTIDQLIKKLSRDKKFAKEFKTLAEKCSRARAKLMEDKLNTRAVTRHYMRTWGEFYKKFAFDPISLAALTVPEISDRADYCGQPTKIVELEILSHTQTTALYDSLKSTQSKTAAKSKSKVSKKKAYKVK